MLCLLLQKWVKRLIFPVLANYSFTFFGIKASLHMFNLRNYWVKFYVWESLVGSLSQSSLSEFSTNQFLSKRSTTFIIHIDHKYLLIFVSDILSKGKSLEHQTEADIVSYFWTFLFFKKLNLPKSALSFPVTPFFLKPSFPVDVLIMCFTCCHIT